MARFQNGSGNIPIEGVARPEGNNDATNKAYVDSEVRVPYSTTRAGAVPAPTQADIQAGRFPRADGTWAAAAGERGASIDGGSYDTDSEEFTFTLTDNSSFEVAFPRSAPGPTGATGASVWVIYADDAAGTGQSFTKGATQEFVAFYEAALQPTLPVSDGTFIDVQGTDGAQGDQGVSRVFFFRRQSTGSVASPVFPDSDVLITYTPSGWVNSATPTGTATLYMASANYNPATLRFTGIIAPIVAGATSGPPGATPNITATVTIIASDTEANVVETGTNANPDLEFRLPATTVADSEITPVKLSDYREFIPTFTDSDGFVSLFGVRNRNLTGDSDNQFREVDLLFRNKAGERQYCFGRKPNGQWREAAVHIPLDVANNVTRKLWVMSENSHAEVWKAVNDTNGINIDDPTTYTVVNWFDFTADQIERDRMPLADTDGQGSIKTLANSDVRFYSSRDGGSWDLSKATHWQANITYNMHELVVENNTNNLNTRLAHQPLYRSVTDGNLNNALSDTDHWQRVSLSDSDFVNELREHIHEFLDTDGQIIIDGADTLNYGVLVTHIDPKTNRQVISVAQTNQDKTPVIKVINPNTANARADFQGALPTYLDSDLATQEWVTTHIPAGHSSLDVDSGYTNNGLVSIRYNSTDGHPELFTPHTNNAGTPAFDVVNPNAANVYLQWNGEKPRDTSGDQVATETQIEIAEAYVDTEIQTIHNYVQDHVLGIPADTSTGSQAPLQVTSVRYNSTQVDITVPAADSDTWNTYFTALNTARGTDTAASAQFTVRTWNSVTNSFQDVNYDFLWSRAVFVQATNVVTFTASQVTRNGVNATATLVTDDDDGYYTAWRFYANNTRIGGYSDVQGRGTQNNTYFNITNRSFLMFENDEQDINWRNFDSEVLNVAVDSDFVHGELQRLTPVFDTDDSRLTIQVHFTETRAADPGQTEIWSGGINNISGGGLALNQFGRFTLTWDNLGSASPSFHAREIDLQTGVVGSNFGFPASVIANGFVADFDENPSLYPDLAKVYTNGTGTIFLEYSVAGVPTRADYSMGYDGRLDSEGGSVIANTGVANLIYNSEGGGIGHVVRQGRAASATQYTIENAGSVILPDWITLADVDSDVIQAGTGVTVTNQAGGGGVVVNATTDIIDTDSIVAGANITVTENAGGGVTIASQQLVIDTDQIVAGSNITVTNNTGGGVTIASTASGGSSLNLDNLTGVSYGTLADPAIDTENDVVYIQTTNYAAAVPAGTYQAVANYNSSSGVLRMQNATGKNTNTPAGDIEFDPGAAGDTALATLINDAGSNDYEITIVDGSNTFVGTFSDTGFVARASNSIFTVPATNVVWEGAPPDGDETFDSSSANTTLTMRERSSATDRVGIRESLTQLGYVENRETLLQQDINRLDDRVNNLANITPYDSEGALTMLDQTDDSELGYMRNFEWDSDSERIQVFNGGAVDSETRTYTTITPSGSTYEHQTLDRQSSLGLLVDTHWIAQEVQPGHPYEPRNAPAGTTYTLSNIRNSSGSLLAGVTVTFAASAVQFNLPETYRVPEGSFTVVGTLPNNLNSMSAYTIAVNIPAVPARTKVLNVPTTEERFAFPTISDVLIGSVPGTATMDADSDEALPYDYEGHTFYRVFVTNNAGAVTGEELRRALNGTAIRSKTY